MKTVLAFGDSLTWGSDPTGAGRHAKADRWTSVLAQQTGFDVIPDGLRGRTTAYDRHVSPADMNGALMLPSVLHTSWGTHAALRAHGLTTQRNRRKCGRK